MNWDQKFSFFMSKNSISKEIEEVQKQKIDKMIKIEKNYKKNRKNHEISKKLTKLETYSFSALFKAVDAFLNLAHGLGANTHETLVLLLELTILLH